MGFLVNGLATIFYGPSEHLGFSPNFYISIAALFIGGISAAYTLIPHLNEMIEESELWISNNPSDKDILTDINSGLFNTAFEIGCIFGPLVGNAGYIQWGAPNICEYVGYLVILIGVLYFFGCDDLFYRRKPLPPYLAEEDIATEKTPMIETSWENSLTQI